MNPNLPDFKQELVRKQAKADYATGESAKSLRSSSSSRNLNESAGMVNKSKKSVRFGKQEHGYGNVNGCSSCSDERDDWERNTVEGPIPNSSLLKRGCDNCVGLMGKICFFLPCKCPRNEEKDYREDFSNVEDVHEVPGVTLATKPKSAGVGITIGSKLEEDQKGEDKDSIIYQKNLETILDYAAKSLNMIITVDNPELLSEAVAVLGTRVRSIQPRIEEDQQAHMPGETFYASKGYKPGKWRKTVWKERYFRLQYDGCLKYFDNEMNINHKGIFPITKDTVVEQPIMQHGKYMLKIKNGPLESFVVALNSLEEATMWAGHFRSIVDFKTNQARTRNPVVRRPVSGNEPRMRQATTAAPRATTQPERRQVAGNVAKQRPVSQSNPANNQNPAYYYTSNNANSGTAQRQRPVNEQAGKQRPTSTTRSIISELSK